MSKVDKWKYNDFFGDQLRREKLVNILLSEIIFLKKQIKTYKLNDHQNCIKTALGKLEYLLEILKNNETCLSDDDFDKIINFIYQIFNNIAKELEKK